MKGDVVPRVVLVSTILMVLLLLPPRMAAEQAPQAPASAGSGEWTVYKSRQDLFQVYFPAQPTIRDMTYRTQYGLTLPGRAYSVADPTGRYRITVVDYTNAERMHAQRAAACKAAGRSGCSDRGSDEVDGAMVHAVWNVIKRSKGKLTMFALYDADRVEGYQVNLLHADDSRTVAVILMHDYRLYIVEATAPKGLPPPLILQSGFGFLDKDGNKVLYVAENPRVGPHDTSLPEVDTFYYLQGRAVPKRRGEYVEPGERPQ